MHPTAHAMFRHLRNLVPSASDQIDSPASASLVNDPHNSFGFPRGYFHIRSLGSGNVLTVGSYSTNDGATLHLWPLQPNEAQTFFVDHTGALCCKAGGNAIDVVDDTVVVRHRHPVTTPWPNPWSHPYPRFTFNASTGLISVEFSCDPSISPDWPRPDQEWKGKEFVLVARGSATFRTRVQYEFIRWAPPSRFAASSTADANVTGQADYALVEDHALDRSNLGRKMWELVEV